MVNRKEATRGIYIGDGYNSKYLPKNKYPIIEKYDKGYFMDLHPWEQEKYEDKRYAFWPDKWGNIYYFIVLESEVKKFEKEQS